MLTFKAVVNNFCSNTDGSDADIRDFIAKSAKGILLTNLMVKTPHSRVVEIALDQAPL